MVLPCSRRRLRWASVTIAAAASVAVASLAAATGAAASTATPAGTATQHTLAPNTRFFRPAPSDGGAQQIAQLFKSGDPKDASLIAKMEGIPRAVWFTSEHPRASPAAGAPDDGGGTFQHAVPVLVAYDIPGRDCAQYSAGGALDQASYQAWIDGFARGIGYAKAIVILEPDALGNMPSNCGLSSSAYPFTDSERIAELQYAVSALEQDPGTSVYLDGTHSAWQSVGTITQRLLQADVQQAQGSSSTCRTTSRPPSSLTTEPGSQTASQWSPTPRTAITTPRLTALASTTRRPRAISVPGT